jgi:hypothetical protein
MPPYALRHVFGTRQGRNGTNQAILCDPAHTNAVNAMAKMIMPIVEKARGKVEPDAIDERTSKAS